MCTISEDQKKFFWNEATPIKGHDESSIRQDPCGAWIYWDKYQDRNSDFGWEIDHIVPQSILKERGADKEEIDCKDNLRAMNWHNVVSKGNDYPVYHSAVKADGDRNVLSTDEFEINKERQERLKRIYSKYL